MGPTGGTHRVECVKLHFMVFNVFVQKLPVQETEKAFMPDW